MNVLRLLTKIILFFCFFQTLMGQEIIVDFADKKQKIENMGINMEGYHTTGGNEVLKSSISEMLSMIPVNVVRIGMPIKEWEPNNDNESPEEINESGFITGTVVSNSFKRLVEMENRGLSIWLSVWDMANWNIEDPSKGSNRRIKSIDELSESILAYLLKAKNDYGVDVQFVSINEVTIASETGYGGYNIGLSAEEQIALIKKSSQLLKANNLQTKWLISVHSVYPSELEQARTVYEDPEVQTEIAGIDFHSYWLQSENRIEHVQSFGDWIAETGLTAYCGELDYDNQFWKRTSEDKKKWVTHGMITAQLYSIIYNTARASGGYPWYSNRPNATTPYRYVALHYHSHILPGYEIVESTVTDPSITAVAATNDQEWSIIVQNNMSQKREITIKGVPGSSAQAIASYNNNYGVKKEDLSVENGEIVLQMEPYSLYSLGNNLKSMPTLVVTSGGNEEIPENYMEAEDGIVGGGSNVDDAQEGYNGQGYVDFGGRDSWTQFDLYFENGGTYDFYVCYACGSKRPCDLYINDELVNSFPFASTGSFTKWAETSLPITVNAGKNTLKLVASSVSGGPNVDYYRWDMVSGLSDVERANYSLYPSLARDRVYIRGGEEADNLKISAFDLQGRIVFSSYLGAFKRDIDVSPLNPGCYWLVAYNVDKNEKYMLRLLKK